MQLRVRTSIAVLAVALGLGCGGASQGALAGDDGSGDSDRNADGGPALADATVSGDDASSGTIFVNTGSDGSTVVVQDGPCAAGVYQGPFMTFVGGGADGGSAGPFSFMENGILTVILSAQKVMMISMTGGEVPTTTSTTTFDIADGGALDASDSIGGHFFADLVGSLDCSPDAGPPYRFSATWANGVYSNPFINLPLVGQMAADYQEAGATSPPMLANGTIFGGGVLMDGGQPFVSASGSWSATWIAPAP
jgi:hypothetical protein